jgi:hypothetical protein
MIKPVQVKYKGRREMVREEAGQRGTGEFMQFWRGHITDVRG